MDMKWKKIASMEYGKIVLHSIPNHSVLKRHVGRLSSHQLENQIKTAEENCYGTVSQRLIFLIQCILTGGKKVVLPANHKH